MIEAHSVADSALRLGGQRSCWVHVLVRERCKMFSQGPMSGARWGQRSCWIHVLICRRCKMCSHGPMSGTMGAMAPLDLLLPFHQCMIIEIDCSLNSVCTILPFLH